MDRRSFLQATAAAGAILLSGCREAESPSREPPTATGPSDGVPIPLPTRSGPRRSPARQLPSGDEPTPAEGTTVTTEQSPTEEEKLTDVVVDASENDEVSDLLNAIDSGQRLVFPSGRFRWTDEVHVTADDWGIRCQDDTVFEVPAGIGDGDNRRLLVTYDRDRTADNVHLENLTFDSPGRAAPSIHVSVRNTGHIDGLQYRMNGPLSHRQHENGLRAYVENDDGLLRIDDYHQFNNGDIGGYAEGHSRIGVYVPPTSEGTIVLRNPILQGFPNNACYVSRQPGRVVIADGLLINNNVSAVRVSGNVLVWNTTVYIDTDRYLDGPGTIDGTAHNTRGLWGDNRKEGDDGGLVTGVSCILKSYQRCTGLATILENPWMTVRNSQFLLDTDIRCVRALDGEIEVIDCKFDGGSDDSTAGVGEIAGTGGQIAPNIDPGSIPVKGRDAEFDWDYTHPQTPNRPTSDSN